MSWVSPTVSISNSIAVSVLHQAKVSAVSVMSFSAVLCSLRSPAPQNTTQLLPHSQYKLQLMQWWQMAPGHKCPAATPGAWSCPVLCVRRVWTWSWKLQLAGWLAQFALHIWYLHTLNLHIDLLASTVQEKTKLIPPSSHLWVSRSIKYQC